MLWTVAGQLTLFATIVATPTYLTILASTILASEPFITTFINRHVVLLGAWQLHQGSLALAQSKPWGLQLESAWG